MLKMIEGLEQSALSNWLNGLLWGFPSAEIFHLLMIGSFFGGMVMLDLRLLGFLRFISSRHLMAYILRCVWWAFAGVVISGVLLFLFMPLEYFHNPALRVKLLLMLLAAANAGVVHLFFLKNIDSWDIGSVPPLGLRISALLSLGLWGGAVACGRLIAYYYGYGSW